MGTLLGIMGVRKDHASSEEGRSHLVEVDCQKSRARVEAQRFQYNR